MSDGSKGKLQVHRAQGDQRLRGKATSPLGIQAGALAQRQGDSLLTCGILAYWSTSDHTCHSCQLSSVRCCACEEECELLEEKITHLLGRAQCVHTGVFLWEPHRAVPPKTSVVPRGTGLACVKWEILTPGAPKLISEAHIYRFHFSIGELWAEILLLKTNASKRKKRRKKMVNLP